jgi:hypothetical protein
MFRQALCQMVSEIRPLGTSAPFRTCWATPAWNRAGRDRLERSDSPQGDRGCGHQTTMIYLHVMKRPGAGAPSPLDFG